MTYEGTHFNDDVVLSQTKKQFLLNGGFGNNLTQEQLSELYDLIKKANANNSKYVGSSNKP